MRTMASMEKSLRAALTSKSTVLRSRQLNGDTLAWVEYEGRTVEVAVDAMRGGLIECVVHELLHAVYVDELARWGVFEECIVLAVERELMGRINRSPASVKWWRNAIAKKLQPEGDA
jgi:hypothetical protein